MRVYALLGLLILAVYVNAKPWLRSDDVIGADNGDDGSDNAGDNGGDNAGDNGGAEKKWEKESLVNYLKEVPLSEIKEHAARIKADLEKALVAVRELEQVAAPISAELKLDPKFMEAGSKLGVGEADLAKHMSRLPPLPEDKELHFLDDCIEVAKNTDFDQYTETHVFLNEVIRQVIVCAASGLEVMVDASDLDSLDDADLTPELVADRMVKLQEAGIEMGHLGKFVMKFFARVFSGGLEKGLTNNELVKGKEGEEDDNKGPKPRPPMGDKKGPKPGPGGKGPGKGFPDEGSDKSDDDDNSNDKMGPPPKDDDDDDDDDDNDDDDEANDDNDDDMGPPPQKDDNDDDFSSLDKRILLRVLKRMQEKSELADKRGH